MNRIQKLREEMGINQKYLAIEIKVSQPTICDWESGRKVPSAKSTAKLADFFNVSIDYLLGRTDTKKDPVQTDEVNAELFKTLNRLSLEKVEVIANLVKLLDDQNHEQH